MQQQGLDLRLTHLLFKAVTQSPQAMPRGSPLQPQLWQMRYKETLIYWNELTVKKVPASQKWKEINLFWPHNLKQAYSERIVWTSFWLPLLGRRSHSSTQNKYRSIEWKSQEHEVITFQGKKINEEAKSAQSMQNPHEKWTLSQKSWVIERSRNDSWILMSKIKVLMGLWIRLSFLY